LGDLIHKRYRIEREIGIGTFGKVLRCEDTWATGTTTYAGADPQHCHNPRSPRGRRRPGRVAIKVVRSVPRYSESAKIEARILDDVNRRDVDGTSHIVRQFDWFEWSSDARPAGAKPARGTHVCLVHERLGASVYEVIKARRHAPLPLPVIRVAARQLLRAVAFCHAMGLVHTDLKPENVLFADFDESQAGDGRPLRADIKVIDFGGATYETEHKSRTIQTRQYRAPEVVLGLGWDAAADVWSVGCILAEMFTGELLFPTHDNAEHLALVRGVLRELDDGAAGHRKAGRAIAGCAMAGLDAGMLRRSRCRFVERGGRLRWPELAGSPRSVRHVERHGAPLEAILVRASRHPVHQAGHRQGRCGCRGLTDAARGCPPAGADVALRAHGDLATFLSLLRGLLVCNPERRWTAARALEHPFCDADRAVCTAPKCAFGPVCAGSAGPPLRATPDNGGFDVRLPPRAERSGSRPRNASNAGTRQRERPCPDPYPSCVGCRTCGRGTFGQEQAGKPPARTGPGTKRGGRGDGV
jgi:serine/threonine protein kinase